MDAADLSEDEDGPRWVSRGRVAAVVLLLATSLAALGIVRLPSSAPGGPLTSAGVAGVERTPLPPTGGPQPGAIGGGSPGVASPLASPDDAAPSVGPPSVATPSPSDGSGPGVATTTATALRTWTDEAGELRLQVLVAVTNTGGAPVVLEDAASTWEVHDRDGRVVTSGRFARAFPPLVAPGGSAYLVETLSATLAAPDELTGLAADVVARPATDDDTARVVELAVDDVGWDAVPGGAIEVTGRVVNRTTRAVDDAVVAVVLRGRDGALLTAAYDASIETLAAGESRSFATSYPGTYPADPAAVAEVAATAFGAR